MENVSSTSARTQLVAIDVPVDKGFLKRSGFVELLPNGIKLGYRAPYSHEVEFGRIGQPIVGDQIVHVKAYRRRAKNLGVIQVASKTGKTYTRKKGRPTIYVKAHDVIYKNKRVIRIRPRLGKFEFGPPSFRVISNTGTTKPQLFLTRSVREGLKFLGNDLKAELAAIGGTK